LQASRVADLEDEEIMDIIPWEFMYRDSKCVLILAAKVHRLNPEIAVDTTGVPSGVSRSEQRRVAAEAAATAAKKRKATIEADVSLRVAQLKVMGLESAVVEQDVKLVVQQLDMLERFKTSIVATEGEDSYHNQVSSLLSEMLKKKRGPTETNNDQEDSTGSGSGSDSDDDDDDA
jgi:hypothetical protein